MVSLPRPASVAQSANRALSLHNATINSSISASTPVRCAKANGRRKCRRFPFGGQVPEVQDALLDPLSAVSDPMRLVVGWVAASCDRKIASGLIEGIDSLVQAAKVKGGPTAQSKPQDYGLSVGTKTRSVATCLSMFLPILNSEELNFATAQLLHATPSPGRLVSKSPSLYTQPTGGANRRQPAGIIDRSKSSACRSKSGLQRLAVSTRSCYSHATGHTGPSPRRFGGLSDHQRLHGEQP